MINRPTLQLHLLGVEVSDVQCENGLNNTQCNYVTASHTSNLQATQCISQLSILLSRVTSCTTS